MHLRRSVDTAQPSTHDQDAQSSGHQHGAGDARLSLILLLRQVEEEEEDDEMPELEMEEGDAAAEARERAREKKEKERQRKQDNREKLAARRELLDARRGLLDTFRHHFYRVAQVAAMLGAAGKPVAERQAAAWDLWQEGLPRPPPSAHDGILYAPSSSNRDHSF